MYVTWSRVPVPGSLAFVRPGKPVPDHKYKTKQGKSELKRGIFGPLVKNYYAGWAEFVKLAKDWKGQLVVMCVTRLGSLSSHIGGVEFLAVVVRSAFFLSPGPSRTTMSHMTIRR
jgi:hypothetical protein